MKSKLIRYHFILSVVFLAIVSLQCDTSNNGGIFSFLSSSSSEPSYIEAPLIKPVEDDYYILGGDILLDNTDQKHDQVLIKAMLDHMQEQQAKGGSADASQAVIGDPRDGSDCPILLPGDMESIRDRWTWNNGVIPYYYQNVAGTSENEYNSQKYLIRQAMNTLETICNVRFVQSNNPDYYGDQPSASPPVYNIYASNKNSSTVGPVNRPRLNIISFNQHYIIVHELCHCLGFHHEHQRHDRDAYVRINWDNILGEYAHNFRKIPSSVKKRIPFPIVTPLFILPSYKTRSFTNSVTFGRYDFDSIMHYGSYDFSEDDSEKTIDLIDTNGEVVNIDIGQRNHLSDVDKSALQILYGMPRIPGMVLYREAQGSAAKRIKVVSGQPWTVSTNDDQNFLVEINPPEAGGTSARTLQFGIKNDGVVALNLTGALPLTLTGDPVFTIVKNPASTIPGGSSSSFFIYFFTEIPGNYEAEVVIENNSHDRIFRFPIRATAYLPTQVQALPSAPDNLTLRSISRYRISLSWNDNSEIETGYAIFRKDSGGNRGFVHVADVGPNVENYEDTGVYYNPNNRWDRVWYQVYAYNDFGRSIVIGAHLPESVNTIWDTSIWNMLSYWE